VIFQAQLRANVFIALEEQDKVQVSMDAMDCWITFFWVVAF